MLLNSIIKNHDYINSDYYFELKVLRIQMDDLDRQRFSSVVKLT
jgi:hypothetical protein